MRKSVRDAWYESIKANEGYTNWLYFDTHKPPLATTGIGNMIDTGSTMSTFGLALPWRFKDGSYATEKEILAEYNRLKGLGISNQGGFAYKDKSKIVLDESVVKWLLYMKTDEFWGVLSNTFSELEDWPADAQLALMNMAWWMGPRFTQSWPTLTGALKDQDFLKASKNCTTVNPSSRNRDNVRRFENADKVVKGNFDRNVLYDKDIAPTSAAVVVTKVSASKVAAAVSSVKSSDAEKVQKMLSKAGFYKTTIDGLFGNQSKAAFADWAKFAGQDNVINKDTLTVLSNQTLKYTIVD